MLQNNPTAKGNHTIYTSFLIMKLLSRSWIQSSWIWIFITSIEFGTLAKYQSSFWPRCRGLLNYFNEAILLLFRISVVYIFVYILKKTFDLIPSCLSYCTLLLKSLSKFCSYDRQFSPLYHRRDWYVVVWKLSSILEDKNCDDEISRLNMWCDLYKENHQGSDCEGKKETINIDYDTQLQNILDDFLMSSQVPFEKFEVQCCNLVEKAYESQQKLVEMETECQATVVVDNPPVMSVGLYLKSQQMGSEKLTHVQIITYPSLRWESLNSKCLTVSAWECLILYAKFMEFLPNKRKKKDDIFFLSFLPP